MTYRSVTHVALHVESLADSETYYGELFGMDVVLREEISMLARDAFSLALEPKEGEIASEGRVAHIGLHVDEAEIERLDKEAKRMDCQVLRLRPDLLIIRDRYGMQWEITTIWPPKPHQASS